MKKITIGFITAILTASVLTSTAFASSGGLDRYGCHTESKTGWYHCHR